MGKGKGGKGKVKKGHKLPNVASGGTSIEQKRWASKQGRDHIAPMKTDAKGKTKITFNMKSRNDFLTSFKKRKDVRR